MRGLMMDTPLLTESLIRFAAEYHTGAEIVSRSVEGPIHRYTYGESHARIQKLANALVRLGVGPGDRVATLAWNGYRHFELYFGISGMGAVCHTINPRLFHDQIDYIVNHAEDRFIFTDLTFVELLESLQDRLGRVDGYVIMTDADRMPETSLPRAMCYETLLAEEPSEFDWPALDENEASALCYTSGTTGSPKGILYSHRSTVLHSLSCCTVDHPFALSSQTTVMPVVPMFHVHAWGIPYGAPMCGAKLVLPGPELDGESLYHLMEDEQVTITAGVPTVWAGLLNYLKESGKKLNHLGCVTIGGAAAPVSMIKAFEEDFDIPVVHAWGMTEMSPVGTTGRLKPRTASLAAKERYGIKSKQGRPIYGVEMKIVNDSGERVARNGATSGQLMARGPWVARAYYGDPEGTAAAFDEDGWFATGDVANMDPDGHVQITDRSKDLIKSGGEWISSIDLENAAVSHPDVAEAAAIAMAHPKWGERPLLVVVPKERARLTRETITDFLKGKVADWWLPDDVVFVAALPYTATGKIAKVKLREEFADYKWPVT